MLGHVDSPSVVDNILIYIYLVVAVDSEVTRLRAAF